MSKRKITVLAAVLLCSLLLVLSVVEGLAGVVLANGTPAIDWYVIGGGGGVHDHPVPYALDATIGQPVVGTDSNGNYDLCAGFWCRPEEYEIHLPVVLRNAS